MERCANTCVFAVECLGMRFLVCCDVGDVGDVVMCNVFLAS